MEQLKSIGMFLLNNISYTLNEALETAIIIAPSVIVIVLIIKLIKNTKKKPQIPEENKIDKINTELDEIEASLNLIRNAENSEGNITPIWKGTQKRP